MQVEVTDTGPGVQLADRERIFERFTRVQGSYPRSTGGNGLGLAIAAALSPRTGHPRLHRPPGQGARFEVRLPRPP